MALPKWGVRLVQDGPEGGVQVAPCAIAGAASTASLQQGCMLVLCVLTGVVLGGHKWAADELPSSILTTCDKV
jgi:hypothetical protein